MSNRRRPSPQLPSLRQVMRENASLREMVKFQSDRIEELGKWCDEWKDLAKGLEAQLYETRLQVPRENLARPADLEDWINEVALGDMDDDERAQWDAMSDEDREGFVDALGQRLAAVESLPD